MLSVENESWPCFKCKDRCSCRLCKANVDEDSSGQDFENNVDTRPNSTNNIITVNLAAKPRRKRKRNKYNFNNVEYLKPTKQKESYYARLVKNGIKANAKKKKKNCNVEIIDGFEIIAQEDKFYDDIDEDLAKSVENFYKESVKDKFNLRKYCIICKKNSYFDVDNLLRFKTYKEFTKYLKYFLTIRKDFLTNSVFSFFDEEEIQQYIETYQEDFKFRQIKIICKHCFLSTLLSDDPSSVFKNSFREAIDKETFKRIIVTADYNIIINKSILKLLDDCGQEAPQDKLTISQMQLSFPSSRQNYYNTSNGLIDNVINAYNENEYICENKLIVGNTSGNNILPGTGTPFEQVIGERLDDVADLTNIINSLVNLMGLRGEEDITIENLSSMQRLIKCTTFTKLHHIKSLLLSLLKLEPRDETRATPRQQELTGGENFDLENINRVDKLEIPNSDINRTEI
jgi:hypothetical protein